ncbi:MAG: cyclic nucleotide-binding domain-containing protein [Thermoanaerobaculia bacterium]
MRGGAAAAPSRGERTRKRDRSRIWFPLLVSVGLLGIYFSLHSEPGPLRRLKNYHVLIDQDLLFLALIPLIFAVVRVIDVLLFDLLMSRRRHVLAPQLLREILAIALYFVLFGGAISRTFNVDVQSWLLTGGAVALIVGLALQETLGNLFSGIALHLEDSFEIGDVIRSGDFTGVVEGTRWRGTRIRTFNNNFVIIPNSLLARERVEIFPRNNPNARVLSVGIDSHVPPSTAIDVLTQAASHVDGVSREMPCFTRVAGFADFAVTYEIKYYTRDYSLRDRIDAEIRRAIWYALRRNGITVPFPIRSYQRYTPPVAADHQLSQEDLIARLRKVDILSPVSDAGLELIAGAARFHVYSRGESILRRGAAGDSLFVMHEGTVSVRVADDTVAGRHEVAQLGPGAVFGEMALLTGQARTADVIALTEVIAIEIGKDALDPVLHEHPELAEAMTAKVMERRDMLEAMRNASREEVEKTIISKIKAYFGLGS